MEWILTKDRLPDERKIVLCYNSEWRRMSCNDWEEYTNKDKDWFVSRFTHWMPLPEHPKP